MSAAPSGGRSRLDKPDRLDPANDMEFAAAILAAVEAAGATLYMEGNKLKVRNSVRLPAAAKSELDAHWRTVADLFAGDRCRYCGHPIDWRRPSSVAFADGTAAHLACYEEAEVARLLEAGRRAVESPDALADPAEAMLKGLV